MGKISIQGRGSSAPGRAILCMLLGVAVLTANDALLKWMTGGYHVVQIMFCRGLFVFIPMALLIWRGGGLRSLHTGNPKGHLIRALLVILGTFLFVSGLKHLPLTDAIAIAFAGPLFIAALAPPLLGEHVGWRRWMAVLAGFIGIVIIMRPGGSIFQWAALFPLAASLTGALRDILTRGMSATDTSVALLFYTSLGVILASMVVLPLVWQPVPLKTWGWFAVNGLLIGSAHYLMIETFRYGEAALVAPFKYSGVVYAAILGYLVWGDIPDLRTVIGVTVVITAGIYILHREQVQYRE